MHVAMSEDKPKEMIIYTYHRGGVALTTGNLNIALKRNDGEREVTMIKKIYN
jgi:hypothetical protein